MLIPSASGYIPLFIEMSKLKLLDSYLAIILPAMSSAFGVFLFRQSMFAVPAALMDAARIDGANDLRLYTNIAVPLVKPMMITAFISSCITTWNDYFWPFIALKTGTKLTFPVVLAGIQGQMFEVPWGIIMVGALILTVPTIIIYGALSKYIVTDIFGGSVKG
jgi:ABC-type glycerol-3-phosphate transport system permease component